MRNRGVRQPYDQTRPRSRLLLEWRASDLSASPITPGTATLTRPLSATMTDSVGATYAAPAGWPSWTVTDGAVGLDLGDGESLSFAFPVPEPCRIGFVFVERGTLAASSGTPLWAVGAGGAARLELTRQGGPRYRVTLTHGGQSVSAETGANPTTDGEAAAIHIEVTADGRVRIGLQEGSGPYIDWSAFSVAHPSGLPSAWSEPAFEVNARDGGDHGDVEVRAVWAAPKGITPRTVWVRDVTTSTQA